MEIAIVPDNFQVIAKQLFRGALDSSHFSVAAAGNIQISGLLSAIDAVASPPVRSTTSSRTATRRLLKRRRCRTRRRPRSSGGSEDGEYFGGGDDGTFGGGGGGAGGGGGWKFDRFGEFGWDDSFYSSADPAFDLVYQVVCWLLFSNCLHFAFKKVVRLVGEGFADHGREKVPMRLTSVC